MLPASSLLSNSPHIIMPFVQVSSEVRLHYEISYCEDNPAHRDSRPWLMIIHPLLMDSAFIANFTSQPVFKSTFNQIIFDARHHGRSNTTDPKNVGSKALDLYSLAADFAIGLQHLNIPAVHGLATHSWASEVLLRMAAVFPFKLLSLCVCSLPPPKLEGFLERAFQECFESTANPESVEEWDEGVSAVQWFNFGEPSLVDGDVLDEWASVLVRRYPPNRSVDCCMAVWPFLGACQASKPDNIPQNLMSQIKHPVLALWGANDTIFTQAGCKERLDELPFHERSTLKVMKDAPLLFCKTHPKETSKAYMKWVEPILKMNGSNSNNINNKSGRQKVPMEEEVDLDSKGEGRWKESLEKIASCRHDQAILHRDPMQSDSYNRNSLEEIDALQQVLTNLKAHQVKTFSMLGGGAPEIWTDASFDEKVPWRFSSRFDEARVIATGPTLHRSKNQCEVESIQIKKSVEVQYHDLIEL